MSRWIPAQGKEAMQGDLKQKFPLAGLSSQQAGVYATFGADLRVLLQVSAIEEINSH